MANVMAICGSLRKGSLNRMLMNASIAAAPVALRAKAALSLPCDTLPFFRHGVFAFVTTERDPHPWIVAPLNCPFADIMRYGQIVG